MNILLKKLLICGASLMMASSLGTGINNVSAKRVNHHARTKRIIKSSRSLYKQGEHDNYNYASALDISPKSRPKIYNHIINKLIQNHFNKSYIKGLDLLKLGKGGSYAGADHRIPIDILSDAKNVARHRRKYNDKDHHKNKRNNINSHKSVKHIRKNKYKRNTKKSHKLNKHHSKGRALKKHTHKRSRASKSVTDDNSEDLSISIVDNPNFTDNGRFYTYKKLLNELSKSNVQNDKEPIREENKVINTIAHYENIASDGASEVHRLQKIGSFYKNNDVGKNDVPGELADAKEYCKYVRY